MSQNKLQENDNISLKEMNEAVMRSGYLLEQRVESVLKRYNYSVQANPIYPDPDTGKSREYDIDATKSFEIFGKHRQLNGIYLKLLCECKHNPQPIVFFNKEIEEPYSISLEIKVSGIPVKFPDEDKELIMGLADFAGMKRYHHYCSGHVATQWCTFQLKNRENIWMALHPDDQHEAFDSLTKALNYQIEEHYDSWRPEFPQSRNVDIIIYYPLVIFEGDLYSGALNNGQLELNKSTYIHFSKEFYLSKPNYVQTVHFDIINENYLPEYIKLIELEVSKLKNSLRSQKQRVNDAIKEIVNNAKKSSQKNKSYRDLLEF